MTIRELRHLLFHASNQDMTIEELRLRLFNEEEQDVELSPQLFRIIANTQPPANIPSNPPFIINRDYDDNNEE